MAASIAVPHPNERPAWLDRWVFYLTSSFMFGAAALRALQVFQTSALLNEVVSLLAAWLIAYVASMLLARRWPSIFALLIGVEVVSTLVLVLMTKTDFFVFLLGIPCMQVMQWFNTRAAAFLVGLTTLLAFLSLIPSHGFLFAFGMAVVYCGGTILLLAYIRSARRAQSLEDQQRALVDDLQRANRELEAHSQQMEQLAAARERQRLALELHDSVTQTLYSMTLTTQAALLLMDRDLQQVGPQLERLAELTQGSLSEMQLLISELTPEGGAEGRLVAYLKEHLEERRRMEGLSVRLEVEGSQPLAPADEPTLFRIAQEALNNIVKHARVSEGVLRLHLNEPFWMEIEDRGIGFDPACLRRHGGLGLVGMRERAAEIGWSFNAESLPGSGTRIRVAKELEEGSRYVRS